MGGADTYHKPALAWTGGAELLSVVFVSAFFEADYEASVAGARLVFEVLSVQENNNGNIKIMHIFRMTKKCVPLDH